MKTPLAPIAVAAAISLTGPLAAQQHPHPGPGAAARQMAAHMAAHMQMMDSLEARLDSAVARMNRASGEARTPAMQDLLRELVAGHKAMHAHMREMASHHPMADSTQTHPQPMQHQMPGAVRPDSAARPRR